MICQGRGVKGFDVGLVGHDGIGHDGGGVGVHQHDLITQPAQSFAGLRSRVVEFAGLADDDGAGTYDEHLVYVWAPGHGGPFLVWMTIGRTCAARLRYGRYGLGRGHRQRRRPCKILPCRSPGDTGAERGRGEPEAEYGVVEKCMCG